MTTTISNANRGGHSRHGETRGGRRGRMQPDRRTMYQRYLDDHREFREYLEENGPRPERVRQPRVEAPASPISDDDFEPTPEWVQQLRVEAPASPKSDDDFEPTPEWVRQLRVEAPAPAPNPSFEVQTDNPEPPPSDDGPSLRMGRDCMHLGGLLEITKWPNPKP